VINTLTELHIHSNGIRDAGASALAEALKVNKTLTELYAYGNRIGADGKALLKACARPGCDVRV